MSTTESAAAPAAHPVPPDADLVKLAYETACEMEEMLGDIRDFAGALLLIARSLSREACDPVARLAVAIEDARDALEDERTKIFHALHPRRHEPDFMGHNGEVEEAAVEVGG